LGSNPFHRCPLQAFRSTSVYRPESANLQRQFLYLIFHWLRCQRLLVAHWPGIPQPGSLVCPLASAVYSTQCYPVHRVIPRLTNRACRFFIHMVGYSSRSFGRQSFRELVWFASRLACHPLRGMIFCWGGRRMADGKVGLEHPIVGVKVM